MRHGRLSPLNRSSGGGCLAATTSRTPSSRGREPVSSDAHLSSPTVPQDELATDAACHGGRHDSKDLSCGDVVGPGNRGRRSAFPGGSRSVMSWIVPPVSRLAVRRTGSGSRPGHVIHQPAGLGDDGAGGVVQRDAGLAAGGPFPAAARPIDPHLAVGLPQLVCTFRPPCECPTCIGDGPLAGGSCGRDRTVELGAPSVRAPHY